MDFQLFKDGDSVNDKDDGIPMQWWVYPMYRAGLSQLTIASLAVIKPQCIDFRSKSDDDEGNDKGV